MNKIAFIIGIVAIALCGCGSEEPETPVQGLEAIIELYEAEDFDTLVRTRYAELAKADADDERIQGLVDLFATRFNDPDKLSEAIATYESALQVEPEFREEGAVAVFNLDGSFIRLSRMPNGKWGFHL